MKVFVKKLNEDAQIPVRGSIEAACVDLCAAENAIVFPGKTTMIGTGLAIQPISPCFGAIFARSGLATKHGLRPANCVGVIDSDYTGEVKVAMYNDSEEAYAIAKGDRIAQLVLLPYWPAEFETVDELNATLRGDGGFGSTGVNDNPYGVQMTLFNDDMK